MNIISMGALGSVIGGTNVRPTYSGYNPLDKISKNLIPMEEKSYKLKIQANARVAGIPGLVEASGTGSIKRSENNIEIIAKPEGIISQMFPNFQVKVVISSERPPGLAKSATYNPKVKVLEIKEGKENELASYEAEIKPTWDGKGIELVNTKDESQSITVEKNGDTQELEISSSSKFEFKDSQGNVTCTLNGFKMFFKPEK